MRSVTCARKVTVYLRFSLRIGENLTEIKMFSKQEGENTSTERKTAYFAK